MIGNKLLLNEAKWQATVAYSVTSSRLNAVELERKVWELELVGDTNADSVNNEVVGVRVREAASVLRTRGL